ncbi:MAG: hypothetical protein GC204_13800 [Chloroflexi bacterium]|nr:hypothetical protein [Chloroflexota bacterium]
MSKPSKGWSERRKKQQACNARRTKPWEKSTGPKSAVGKRISSMNAYKTGHHSAAYAALRAALRLNREFLRYVALFYAFEQQHAEILARKRTEGKANEIKGDPPLEPDSGGTN